MRLQVLGLLFPLAFLACGGSADQKASQHFSMTFQAAFLAQGNISFAAVYVAKERGYFLEEGLDVAIEHSSPGGGEQLQRLAIRDIHFTTHTASNFVKLMDSESPPPFLAVAVLGHESDHALMAWAESEIQEISDLRGKRVAFKTGESQEPPWLLAMLVRNGLRLEDVELVPVGFDPRVILPEYGRGRVDAVQAFKSNEPDTLQRAGYQVRLFNPEDYGVHFLGQIYITHRDFAAENPERVHQFVRATTRALAFMHEPANKEIVTDIIMTYAGREADRDHQEFMWQTELQYTTSDSTRAVGLGYASPEQWTSMMQTMRDFGSIESPLPLEQIWDPRFVETIASETEGNSN